MLRRQHNARERDTVRRRAEQFLKELETDCYAAGAGLADTSNVAAIYEKYADLPNEALFKTLRAEAKGFEGDRSGGDGLRRTEFLAELVGGLVGGARTKELADQWNALEARAEVTYPWGTEPYRQSAVSLANEPDRGRRRAMAAARRVVVEQLTPLARDMIAHEHETARVLGFESYTSAVQEVGRLDLGAVHAATKSFLRQTESLYRREMSAAVSERLGQDLADTETCDIGYLWRAPEFDAMFPPDSLVSTAERAVRALGLDIYAHGHIHLDIEQRPKKTPRAFVATIEVPNRVILVISPSGGQRDWHSFFHELGHALHFGYADAELDFEFRRLGDNSVTEAFAFLMQHLLLEPEFLNEYLPNELAGNYLRFAHRNLLYMLRGYCAKLDYELALHDSPGDDNHPAAYADKLGRATLVTHDPANYLVGVDPDYYCARYLRAWFFEAALAAHLAAEYGPRWFTRREAGRSLQQLWAQGQRLRLDELEAHLGFTPTDPAPLVKRITKHLQN